MTTERALIILERRLQNPYFRRYYEAGKSLDSIPDYGERIQGFEGTILASMAARACNALTVEEREAARAIEDKKEAKRKAAEAIRAEKQQARILAAMAEAKERAALRAAILAERIRVLDGTTAREAFEALQKALHNARRYKYFTEQQTTEHLAEVEREITGAAEIFLAATTQYERVRAQGRHADRVAHHGRCVESQRVNRALDAACEAYATALGLPSRQP